MPLINAKALCFFSLMENLFFSNSFSPYTLLRITYLGRPWRSEDAFHSAPVNLTFSSKLSFSFFMAEKKSMITLK